MHKFGRAARMFHLGQQASRLWVAPALGLVMALVSLMLLSAIGAQAAMTFGQNFDGVTAPALPAGWTTSVLQGHLTDAWTTVTNTADTQPNSAFTAETGHVADKVLSSPPFTLTAQASTLTFRQQYDMQCMYDGGVLEISIAGGSFQDILAAGGSFNSGGYSGVLTTTNSNPLAARQAWTCSSSGWITTSVSLPAGALGQAIQLRWRVGTGKRVGGVGQYVDTIRVSDSVAPIIASLNIAPATINENDSVTLTGSLDNSDALDSHSISILWGDGSPTGTIALAAGQLSFTATHQYLNNPVGSHSGVYTVTTTASDSAGLSTSSNLSVTVVNVKPALSNVAVSLPVLGNGTATLTGNISDPGTLDTFSLTVDWGDGSQPTILPLAAGTTSFNVQHQYSVVRGYPVSVTISDEDGDSDNVMLMTLNNLFLPIIAR